MTGPDYPILGLPSAETYQLAQIATYIADRLARHRATGNRARGRLRRAEAVRDLAAAATALNNTLGTTVPDIDLPRPLDAPTFAAARSLVTPPVPRTAEVVSLAGAGHTGWAVIGSIPGVGAVGAHVSNHDLAEALRTHFLTRPAHELTTWAVTEGPTPIPTLPNRIDLPAFVGHLDPAQPTDRAIAKALRGSDRRTDAAIRDRFAGVNLDTPPIALPPHPDVPTPRAADQKTRRTASPARAVKPSARLRLRPAGAPSAASAKPTTAAKTAAPARDHT